MGLEEGRRPPESRLPERMPVKLDDTPSRGAVQIFSLEEINAISLLSDMPIDPSDDLAEPESLDLADDPPMMAALVRMVSAAARADDVHSTLADVQFDAAGQLKDVVLSTPISERRLSGTTGPGSCRSVVSHFSPEDLLALDKSSEDLLALDKSSVCLDLPDDLWLYCLRFLDFKMQGIIPRLSKRFLALSDCQEHWRNVAAHRGYTEGGRVRGETAGLASGGWREYCKQQSRREQLWREPERCNMHVVPDCHAQWSPAIVYSPRSQEIVTCSYDGTVRTWLDDSARAGTYPCTRVLTTEEGEGFSVVTIAPESVLGGADGMLLAAGSEYGNLHVWQVDDEEARRLAHVPTAHDFVQSAVWTPTGRVITGGDSGVIQVHDLGGVIGTVRDEDEARTPSAPGGGGAVPTVVSSPSSPTSGAAATVQASGASSMLEGHSQAVMCMTMCGRGHLVSGSVDHTVRVWDLTTGRQTSVVQAHSRSVHCVCTLELDSGSPYGHGAQLIFSGSRDHSIKVWDLRTNKCAAELRGHAGSITSLGAYQWQLASGGGFNRGMDDDTVLSVDSTLRLWDVRSMRCLWTKDVPNPPGGTAHPKGDPVLCLQLLHDKILTSHGGKDWTARVWQVTDR
mmetsp:Transcript_11445/g.29750  ORF Transcript_11445/g.29750 Transcript_11445/m.29750 type:complete len:624 (+) Transcript_11445:66-1937(+)